jgi:hypothetical protein
VKGWVEVAQVGSAIAAAIGLFLTAYSVCRSRMVADLQALQEFLKNVTEREAALLRAPTDDARDQAFNEFMNFLEVYAGAFNRRLFGWGSRKLVRHKLEDSFIELNESPQWKAKVQKAVDRSTTFLEFRKFVTRNRLEIDKRAAERAAAKRA